MGLRCYLMTFLVFGLVETRSSCLCIPERLPNSQKDGCYLGVVAHACDPRTWEANKGRRINCMVLVIPALKEVEAGGSRPPSAT